MRKSVTKNHLSGWRNPTNVELGSLGNYISDLRYEEKYYIVTFGIILIMCIVGLWFTSILSLNIILVIALVICIIVPLAVADYFKVRSIEKLRNSLRNKNYVVGDCYIDHIERKIKLRGLRLRMIRLAYLYNDLEEYCIEPIEVEEEIEYTSSIEDDNKFIIINIENKTYKVIEII